MAISGYRGLRIKRIEDPRLLAGRGTFVDNLTFPGMRHIAVVRSLHAHAMVRRISAPGSVELIRAQDLGGPLWLPGDVDDGAAARHPALAVDRVCYVGQPVAVVIADDAYRAADALEQVQVEYESLPAIVDPEQALRQDAPRIHPDLRSNVAHREHWRRGAPARAFGRAAVKIARRIHHQRLASVPLEGRAVVAAPPEGGERTLTVWSSTQMPHGLRDELESLLPLKGIGLRVIAPDVGGGFGAKGNVYSEEVLVPLLALRLGRPLKWVETRRENVMTMCHGRSQFADIRLAAARDGRILAWEMRVGDARRCRPGRLPALHHRRDSPADPGDGPGAVRHPRCRGRPGGSLHQQGADRSLSRRRPARGHVLPRAGARSAGGGTGARSGRGPATQLHSSRGVSLPRRVRGDLRQRQLRGGAGARARGFQLHAVAAAAG